MDKTFMLIHYTAQFSVCIGVVAALNWLARLGWDFYQVYFKIQNRKE